MNACIFAGPTLPPRDGTRALDAIWLPPAQHGDVYRAVRLLRPRALGIVDGYFQSVPSVWHKEILWAIHEGVHVFGAASMGALRAAELAPFGMRGVGCIFEAYRSGMLAQAGDASFEDDDEVAIVHGPAESGYLPASEAMVNIRCTLADAEREGVIGADLRVRLVAIAKALFFPERSYASVLESARAAALPAPQLLALRAWLPTGRVDQKRVDGLAMLDAMRQFLAANPPPASASFSFEHTTLWERAVAALQPLLHSTEEARVLDELRLDGRRFHQLRREVLDSLLARDPAPDAGPTPGRQERSHQGEPRLQELAQEDAAHRVRDEIPAALTERQMLARIRATGEYAALLARADDKQAQLAACANLPRTWEFSELQLLDLELWYFSRLLDRDRPADADLEDYLRDSGYPDMMRFHEAIFAEYAYRQMTGATTEGSAASAVAESLRERHNPS